MHLFINKLNSWRNNSISKYTYEFGFKLNYLIRNILGYCRGLFINLTGKIKYENSYRPLIVGASTQLLVRPGSSITLKNDTKQMFANVYHNNFIFLSASTIGMRPHYWALDPPVHGLTRIELLENAELILEQNTMILAGSYITASNDAKISIGQNSYISQEVIINSRYSIEIGRNVLIGYQVMMMDYDAHTIHQDSDQQQEPKTNRKKGIVINDNVWIGAKVTILKGVTIGAGSVIGANSCVVSDIPENSIAVGNPAKIVRRNITWQR